jgi:hypothetical protein
MGGLKASGYYPKVQPSNSLNPITILKTEEMFAEERLRHWRAACKRSEQNPNNKYRRPLKLSALHYGANLRAHAFSYPFYSQAIELQWALRMAVMNPLSEDKLVSLLAEIQSDIRQIKSDLQALLVLLKHQESATSPSSFSDDDQMAEPAEGGQSASPEDVLRYLRETRGEDDMGE